MLLAAAGGGAYPLLRPTQPTLHEQAISLCRQAVLDGLKAPATAKFPGGEGVQEGPGFWVVTGQVDAENSFSAMRRVNGHCDYWAPTGAWSEVSAYLLEAS